MFSQVILRRGLLCCLCCLAYGCSFIGAFVPASRLRTNSPTSRHTNVSLPSSKSENTVQDKTFYLSREDIKPLVQFGKGEKEKLVNAFGLWCLAVTALTCPIWSAAMTLLNLVYKLSDEWDPHRAVYDATGKVWARSWLTLSNSMPTFSGHVEQLKEGNGPCLYVANHASWLDIPILCTVLDPVFKFIAKGELRGVPCIGQQLTGVSEQHGKELTQHHLIDVSPIADFQGHHILIDREDRRSQLRTFKDGISWLKKGIPLMAFPEGKRSKDGRLMDFKGGLFSMATKTKVPIVPISISHAHTVMPCNALFPVQSGRGKLHVHVHKPIEAAGKSEEELVRLVREAFLSTLPFEQHPKDDDGTSNIVVDSNLPTQKLPLSIQNVNGHETLSHGNPLHLQYHHPHKDFKGSPLDNAVILHTQNPSDHAIEVSTEIEAKV